MRRLLAPIPFGSTFNSRDELIYQSLDYENDWSNHSVNGRFVPRVLQRGQDFCSQKEQNKIGAQQETVILLTGRLVLRYFAATFAVSVINVLHAIAISAFLDNGQTICPVRALPQYI
jgi:hypothetical protein